MKRNLEIWVSGVGPLDYSANSAVSGHACEETSRGQGKNQEKGLKETVWMLTLGQGEWLFQTSARMESLIIHGPLSWVLSVSYLRSGA